jgi:hypothetical protein
MKKIFYTALIALVTTLVSCGGENGSEQKNILADTQTSQVHIAPEVLAEMISTLPQPIEIAEIISQTNAEVGKNLLVPSENSKKFDNAYDQSLAFGAYGVDLGYINITGKTLYTLEYLENIQILSTELKVQQFFNFRQLSDFVGKNNNPDSLVQMSTENFNKIDSYLREQKRGELSALMLIGAWIEGMNVLGELDGQNPSQEIRQRIAEQKVVFDNIYVLTDKLREIPYFNTLNSSLTPLKDLYARVQITYEHQEPEMQEVNGELVFVDKTKTNVVSTPEDLNAIISEVKNLRTKYLIKP